MKLMLQILFIAMSIVLIGFVFIQPTQQGMSGSVPVESKQSKITFVLIGIWVFIAFILMQDWLR